MQDENLYSQRNYIAVELDGKYTGRIALDSSKQNYVIAKDLVDTDHTVLVCKTTESSIGYIEFSGIICNELVTLEDKNNRLIEFIGNSITCGMGLDTSGIPCESGEWYDQHNAYLAYGPLAARALNAEWLLSSVSGIGMTRYWNTAGPTMPEVYENLYLNDDSMKVWKPENLNPDLVSICLGQNDFSDGEGPNPRVELDSTDYAEDYIRFLKKIRKQYPDAQITCISSPMIDGDKKERLFSFLNSIVQYMHVKENDTKVHLFEFKRTYNKGCSWHPSREDHLAMSYELLPFYKKIMGW